MLDYLHRRNRDPKPFVWKADADLILGTARTRETAPKTDPISQVAVRDNLSVL